MTGTRAQLLSVAAKQFADRGFYGTSIASISTELDLSKQALLHHFGTKEKLYGEILQGISARAMHSLAQLQQSIEDPQQQFEEAIVERFFEELNRTDDARLIMRELLDNERRAEKAGNWYLKPYLEALVTLLQQAVPDTSLSHAIAMSIIAQLLGAANYLVISQPTLRSMFGTTLFEETKAVYEQELRTLVRCRLLALQRSTDLKVQYEML